ncbi:hypothetical protein KEM55_003503, partial [Ascosphaera atra]
MRDMMRQSMEWMEKERKAFNEAFRGVKRCRDDDNKDEGSGSGPVKKVRTEETGTEAELQDEFAEQGEVGSEEGEEKAAAKGGEEEEG